MLFVRFVALVAVIAVGVSVLLYLVTGQAKWRRIAWRVFSVAAVAIVAVLLLLLAERLLVAV